MPEAPSSSSISSSNSSDQRTTGRRHRPGKTSIHKPSTTIGTATSASNTISNGKLVSDAKARFVASVSRGISVLMEECGYSRERATAALLREMTRGEISSAPDEKEIFEVMGCHGFSIEVAASALAVSKALQREIADRKVSMVQAIDDLTSKLSVTNLIQMDHRHGAPSPVPASTCCDDVVSITPRTTTEMRIQPVVSSIERPMRQKTKTATPTITATSSSTTTTATTSSNRKTKSLNKNSKQKNANGNRKRSMEDMNLATSQSSTSGTPISKVDDFANNTSYSTATTRARSDSLSEVVNAKFSGNKAKLAPEVEVSSVRAGAAKRARVDADPEASQTTNTNMKRPRTSSAGEL